MESRLEAAELRREYAPARNPTPRQRCLSLAAYAVATFLPQPPVSAALAASGDSACAAYFICLRDGSPAARLRYAPIAEAAWPDLEEPWRGHAEALISLGRWSEAGDILRAGLQRVTHPLDRLLLEQAKLDWLYLRGDRTAARDQWRAMRAAARRDGRPALIVVSLTVASVMNAPPPLGLGGGLRAALLQRARLANRPGQGDQRFQSLRELGHQWLDAGQPLRALACLDTAVAVADSLRRPGLSLVAYTQRGRALAKLGRLAEARRDLLRAIAAGARAFAPLYAADAWHNLAHVYEEAGQYGAARVAVERFVALVGPMGNTLRITSLLDEGTIRWKAGDFPGAIAAFDAMRGRIDEQHEEYQSAGLYLERIGELRGALSYYRLAAAEDGSTRAEGLAGETRVFDLLDEPDSAAHAAAAHDSMVSFWTPLEVPLMPAILAGRGQVAEAVQRARHAALEREAAGDVEGAARAHNLTAWLLLAHHLAGPAALAALQAERLAERVNATDQRIAATQLRGSALVQDGERAEGLRTLDSARRLVAVHPTAQGVFAAQTALGDALGERDPARALEAYERAARVVEGLSGRLDADLDRAGVRETHLAPFDGALRLLDRRGSIEPILRWSARRTGAALALQAQVALRRRGSARHLDLLQVRRRLRAGDALVSYLVLDSMVRALVITRDRAVWVRLETSEAELAEMVARLRRPLTAAYAGRVDLARAPFDLGLAHRLHEILIAPLASSLGAAGHLYVVPDGPLHELSFDGLVSALPPPGSATPYADARYVLDDREVTILPSVDFLGEGPRETRADGRILFIAYRAPGGDHEADAVRQAVGRHGLDVLRDSAATIAAYASLAPSHGVVHFAVHAAATFLTLAPRRGSDGILRLGDIESGQLGRARLIVLSGCETGTGRIYRGEGVLGLARAFVIAGAANIVANQWPVAGAADVMGRFYAEMEKGRAPGSALRVARLAVRHDPLTAHPFHWAGWMLVAGSTGELLTTTRSLSTTASPGPAR